MKSRVVFVGIFTNGHRRDRKNAYEWKRHNQEGFREAVQFFNDEIPEQRALVVFLLLSEDQVMIEAAEALIASFPDQWMVISESEELADNWAKELIRRHCIDEKTWKDNSIIGMSLYEICESVKRIQGPVNHYYPTLASRTGSYIPLMENLPDLDVLSADECDNFQPPPPMTFGKLQEEEFYKGREVSWWNFWYKHVLDRTKLHDLKKLISRALSGGIDDEDQHVGRIGLYHQAGAGGTTLAMNALWDHRKTHRCAVINNISDPSKTAQQILKLRQYGEQSHPKPVIMLLDNLEEEKSNLLLVELEERAKQIARMDSAKLSVVCVLINCIRRNTLPKEHKNKRILLKHELDSREKAWFERKYRDMEQHHQDYHTHPKHLMSFNIMKENFNHRFMKRTVAGLIADLSEESERKLIKYVALLNAFDIQSQAIPTAAFDMMMTKTKNLWSGGLRYGPGAYKCRWESNLSTTAKVLLNASSQVSFGHIHAIEIVSPLLSKHILDCNTNIRNCEANSQRYGYGIFLHQEHF